MSNGFGAGFGGLVLLVALVVVATLLGATTAVAVYWRHRRSSTVQYVAVGLVGVVVAVAGFGIAALVDEASRIAALFVVTVAVPLLLVASRARWRGTAWIPAVALSGMAWSLPFLAGVGVLYALTVTTDASTGVMTGAAGVVTTGGALLFGESVRSVLIADEA